MSVGFSIEGYDVWLIMAKIKGIDFNRDQLAKNEYLDIDIGERSFRWVEEAERGIDLIFGDTEQEVRINTRLWCASECEDSSAQSN